MIWAGGILISLFLAFGLLGYFWLPGFAKSRLETTLSHALHRPVRIERIAVSPYRFSASIIGFKAGDVLSLKSLTLKFSAASFIRLVPVVNRVDIQQPEIRLVRESETQLNISDLLDARQAKPASAAPEFVVSNITVERGKVEWIDKVAGGTQTISDISIGLPFISSVPSYVDVFVEPRLSARINGSPFSLKGRLLPFHDGRDASVRLKFDDIDLTNLTRYSKLPLAVQQARLDANLQIHFRQPKGGPQALVIEGDADLHHVDLSAGRQKISFSSLKLAGIKAEPSSSRLMLGEIALIDPKLEILRGAHGAFDIGVLSSGEALHSGPDSKLKSSGPEWSWLIQKIAVREGKIHYEDAALHPRVPLNISGFGLQAGPVSSTGTEWVPLNLAAQVNERGSINVEGSLTTAGNADIRLKLNSVDIVALQGWVAVQLNVVFTRGNLNFEGRAKVNGSKARVNGNLTLNDFNILDRVNAQDLLSWKSLSLADSALEITPLSISVGAVSLNDFYARALINPEGRLNLRDVVKESGTGTAKKASASDVTPLAVRIGAVSVSSGTVDFTDKYIRPNYSARITGLNGRIGALAAGTYSAVELHGNVDRTAPLEIVGQIDPFSAQLGLDIRGSAKGVDLPSFSSYSGRYAGYVIEKGKLSMDVSYKIRNGELVAENKLFLDQLTLGSKVESKDAIKLPIRLAVALLKNRRGEIDLNLPIRGSLNDPEFSLRGIIGKVLVNLISKAVTSPFKLLGSIFGGGKDLSQVGFDTGSSSLKPEAESHLHSIVDAMTDRPGLDLEITGMADPAVDMEGLKLAMLDRRLRTQKLAEQARQGKSGTLAEVNLGLEERTEYLSGVYKDEVTAGKLSAALSPEGVEKQLLESISVNETDLLNLAEERGKAVQLWLINNGGVSLERIFLRSPKVETAGKGGAGNRVEFSLR
jgi:uncharacterized protein involved in outer membrane biogenesis